MAPPQRMYTHGDLEAHALQNFPDTYNKISAVSYVFVSQDLAEVVTPASTDLLQVAYWNFKKNNVVVWARISPDGSSFSLEYFKKEEGLTDAGQPYPDGRSNIQAYVAPFIHIPPRKWPENIARREKARLDAREQFALSVKFAFLHTGRIRRITSAPETDLHDVFEQLCAKIPDADDDTEDDMEPESASASRPSAKLLGKRPVVDSSSEDDYTETYSRLSTDILPLLNENLLTISKGLEPDRPRKSSRLSTGNFISALSSDHADEPSDTLKKLYAAVTKQCKAEAVDNLDQEKRAFELKIQKLEKQVNDQQEEIRQWKTKYSKLQGDVKKALGKAQN